MDRSLRRLVLFGALLAWCGALLTLSMIRTRSIEYAFLGWNLALATIPLVAAFAFARAQRRRAPVWAGAVWFGVWLLFLPNAPYIATDLLHLAPRRLVPFWFDAALFLSFAGTGLLLGYASIFEVHRSVARRFGAAAGWGVACAAVIASAVGVYAGRVLRWNSWDVVLDPLRIVRTVVASASHPLSHRFAAFLICFCAAGLLAGYAALRAFMVEPSEKTGLTPRRAAIE